MAERKKKKGVLQIGDTKKTREAKVRVDTRRGWLHKWLHFCGRRGYRRVYHVVCFFMWHGFALLR